MLFTWKPFPFLRISAALIAGILSYPIFVGNTHWWLLFSTVFILYILLVWLKSSRILTGIAGLVLIGLIGWQMAYQFDEKRMPFHYDHLPYDRSTAILGTISSDVLEKVKYDRYDVDLFGLVIGDSVIPTSGKIHFYLKKTDSLKPLVYGQELLIQSPINRIPAAKNPSEFDYQKYAERMRIYGQCFVTENQIKLLEIQPLSRWTAVVITWRRKILDGIDLLIKSPRERQIAKALLIGEKNELDTETKRAYSAAGAMHVLAVSGLHVGIIFLILGSLLAPLKKLQTGHFYFTISIIAGIWLYAFLTGLSPSVMRAATMFSVISLKDLRRAHVSIYNSLGLAAFILLLYDPNFIYSVGFQLSFIAVFGIVYFYPHLYRLIIPKYWLLDKIWGITCVSIAAQLATFPLTIYYFHQFPVYFLISNLFVIPGAFLLLVLGIPSIIISLILPHLAMYPGRVVEWTIFLMNEIVFTVEKLPYSLITWLYMNQLETLLCYLIIVMFFIATDYKSFFALSSSLLAFAFMIVSIHKREWDSMQQDKLVIYEIRDRLAIDMISGRDAKIWLSKFDDKEIKELKYQFDPARLSWGLPPIDQTFADIRSFDQHQSTGPLETFVWNGYLIGIMRDSLKEWEIRQEIKLDFLILTENADLDYDMTLLQSKQIIIAPDIQHAKTKRLLQKAARQQLNVYTISQSGAWIMHADS